MRVIQVFVLLLMTGFGFSAPAVAQADSALVGLHELRREGRAICMVGHYHVGTSSGQRTKRAARLVAMRDWAGFTAWEYGNHWGRPKISKNKSMSCSKSTTGWACEFSARPCKGYKRRRVARRKR